MRELREEAMRIFDVPYRWIPRCWWSNISHIIYDLRNGIRNVFRWIPVIWFDSDYDWDFLNTILIYKFERMARCLNNGYHSGSERDAKHLRICAELCRRMGKDEYADNYNMFGAKIDARWAKHSIMMSKQDQEMLGKIIGKYYMHWWN